MICNEHTYNCCRPLWLWSSDAGQLCSKPAASTISKCMHSYKPKSNYNTIKLMVLAFSAHLPLP
jgi:hypothetical protein